MAWRSGNDVRFEDVLDSVAMAAGAASSDYGRAGSPASFWRTLSGIGAVSGGAATEAAARAYHEDRSFVSDEEETVPSTDPREIALELGSIDAMPVVELTRLRRRFAAENHPDRVPQRLRAIANTRMTIANTLIDAAIRRHG
ncbi:hypothetical protein NPA31_008540 [Aurantimonas sp. MSK8Z-1]|uniref:hypothetical protein n=1 Tax=Mangrovibrevibacter kandeliae TaxID=2968473 RepID=UPI0021191CAA|nr:hypothetical protein [Aurantimonas sp. MSK8Z-1]MCW4115000.1 hypothetical protein [Aurantimonas sp. MSK8Z-1]